MKLGLIYMCKNILNNKIYIGQTFSGLENRIKKHYSQLNSDTTHFHRALKKYDKYALIWGILEENILDEDIDEREKYYISLYESRNTEYGYNSTSGGRVTSECHMKIPLGAINEIVDKISNTKISFQKIGEMYNVSLHAISDINREKSWFNEELKYPLRDNGKRKTLSKELVESIINDLIEDVIPTLELAKKYSVNVSTINDLLKGRTHRKKDLEYPLREVHFRRHSSMLKIQKSDLKTIWNYLSSSSLTINEIAKIYNVSPTTISDIDKGRSWSSEYSGDFPIRKKFKV